MKPLLDVNLVCPLTSPNPRLVSHHFHLATPLVHQFDHPVSAENPNERDSTEDDAPVDVGHLASLKVVVALEEDAVLQQGTVQLGRLGDRHVWSLTHFCFGGFYNEGTLLIQLLEGTFK